MCVSVLETQTALDRHVTATCARGPSAWPEPRMLELKMFTHGESDGDAADGTQLVSEFL